ncbi:MAG: ABC transporter ATP-binding protein [[Clostridium] cellulosi]|jgi:ABC transporter.|nr:MAG: ABC transporter ATP-binding protein [[Clostridium] cellulosi]
MTLEIIGLSKSYGTKRALDSVSMTLTPGVYGLLGPNGAGKSTLMNLIVGNLVPDEGKILFDGQDIYKMGASFRALLGYMPQQQGLYDTFTAKRFLYYMASLKGIKKSDAREQIARALRLVNLEGEENKRLSAFSGGMKQRILIAQAILGDPKVLVFDEPTAGLDPKERIRIRNLIAGIALERIVIIATHVVSDIEYIAKEVLLLKSGSLIAKEEPGRLLERLEGRVFELTVPEEKLAEVQAHYKVGNIAKVRQGVAVRVLTDVPPKEYSPRETAPMLEDVYLDCFGDEPEGEKVQVTA